MWLELHFPYSNGHLEVFHISRQIHMDELKVIPEFEVDCLQVPDTVGTTVLLFSVETAFQLGPRGPRGLPPNHGRFINFSTTCKMFIFLLCRAQCRQRHTYGHSMMFAHDCCSSWLLCWLCYLFWAWLWNATLPRSTNSCFLFEATFVWYSWLLFLFVGCSPFSIGKKHQFLLVNCQFLLLKTYQNSIIEEVKAQFDLENQVNPGFDQGIFSA